MTEPTTVAGKRLDSAWPGTHLDRLAWHEAIAQVEVEAAASVRAARPDDAIECPLCGGFGYLVDQTALVDATFREGHRLRILDAATEPPSEPK